MPHAQITQHTSIEKVHQYIHATHEVVPISGIAKTAVHRKQLCCQPNNNDDETTAKLHKISWLPGHINQKYTRKIHAICNKHGNHVPSSSPKNIKEGDNLKIVPKCTPVDTEHAYPIRQLQEVSD